MSVASFAYLQSYPFDKNKLRSLADYDKVSEVTKLDSKYPVEFAKMIEKRIDSCGSTMLMIAAYNGSGKVAIYLIPRMKNINQQKNSGYTALMFAANNNNFEIVKMLVAAGCDITLKDNDGFNALNLAKRRGNTSIAKYLENTEQQV